MHSKFIDRWCDTFNARWEDAGEEYAVEFLQDRLNDEEIEQVRLRFPAFVQEQEDKLHG